MSDWQLGWSASRQQSLDHAFEVAQKALALDDSDSQAHAALGEIYLWKKQYERAVAESHRAVALNPNNADRYVSLADTLAWVGRAQEAVRHVATAMRLNPSYPFNYLWVLGHAHFIEERYEDAIAALTEVRDRNPNFWPAHIYLAASYAHLGRQEEAKAAAAEAFRLHGDLSADRARAYIPYKNPVDMARVFDGLRQAGVTE